MYLTVKYSKAIYYWNELLVYIEIYDFWLSNACSLNLICVISASHLAAMFMLEQCIPVTVWLDTQAPDVNSK